MGDPVDWRQMFRPRAMRTGRVHARETPEPVAAAQNSAQKKNNGDYSASSITVLEGLEAVRKRPGMYIGSTVERGLHHLSWEADDNSVDESMPGYATYVHVSLLADGGISVVDDGRGIPVDEHPVEKKPAVEMVLTMLHAGGKFDDKSYAVSGGLHGVGISVVNALSTALDVEIHRDGQVWTQHYDHSVPGELVAAGKTRKTGTSITFWADPNIFETTTYNLETVSRRLQEMAFLNKGLTIVLRDERKPENTDPDGVEVDEAPDAEGYVAKVKERTFHYPGGLEDFVAHINHAKEPIHRKPVGFQAEGTGHQVEVAMQWNSGYSESVYTFCNTINTTEGGTHEEGFRSALPGHDIREGLAAMVSGKVPEPQFEGQTKTKLGNTEVRSFVQKVCNEHLADWFEANPAEAKTIINKAVGSAQARLAARKARELVRRKTAGDLGGLPAKLAVYRSNDPERSEVYI